MTKSSPKERILNNFLFIVAAACLIITAIQYPLSTTFPMGGDGSAIITTVQHALTQPLNTVWRISNSWYPVSYILFSLNALNPFVYWPVAFSWWMALGQILTGCAIAFLAYRLSGIRAAAIAMAIWAMTPITMTSFFEDGTMAQLWSLPWIMLFFERMFAKSLKGMALCCLLSVFSHPITALVLIVTMLTALPHLFLHTKRLSASQYRIRKIIIWCVLASGILIGCVLYARLKVFTTSFVPESSKYSQELFHGFFLPWLFAGIIGLIITPYMHKKQHVFLAAASSFVYISFFLAINDQLGIGFWTNRLNAYLVIALCVSAGVGMSHILSKLQSPVITTALATCLILGMAGTTFHDNQNIYKRYESPSTYARLHPDELVAIAWAKNNITEKSTIISSDITRHYEWIPVLSDHRWRPIEEKKLFLLSTYAGLRNPFIIFFLRKEHVPSQVLDHPELYHLEFQNNGTALYRITL